MWRLGSAMTGSKFSYGWKENLQFSVSTTFHLNPGEHPVGRFTATMLGNPEIEGLLAWRFLHKSTGIATRNECTLFVGGSALTQQPLRADGPPLQRQPGLYGAVATGHISRTYSVWAGAGFQHYGAWNSHELDHQSDSFLTSLALGGDLRSWPATMLSQTSGCFGKRRARGLDTLGEAQPNPLPLLPVVVVTTRIGSQNNLRRIRAAWLSYQIPADRESIRVQHFFIPTIA